MVEVTAEMIERGRGIDPRTIADRRRVTQHVRDAREKLTSSGTGYRADELDLLRLYATRRKAALPGLALLALGLALVTARWASPATTAIWASIDLAALLFAFGLADRFLGVGESRLNIRRWKRLFITSELLQANAMGAILLLELPARGGSAADITIVALLLSSVMNATVASSIPLAVYAGLAPILVAVLAVLRPDGFADDHWLFAGLALGALTYFAILARQLHASALQSLSFRADKDDLIGELEQSRANSDLARSRAEESNLAKSRFLATMSHELRTPLNAILGFSEIMKAELFGTHTIPAYKDYSNDIHSSGEHLLMLINEILDLSRVEAGRYELREESVDLRSIVDDCRHLLSLRAKKKDILIRQETGEPLPRVWADERALRQVALNLLSNAIKFTPQGGLVKIITGWTPDGGQFFSIIDTGNGIPENEIPIVMSSFGRGALAHKNAEEGTGLGLPIVKGLVELHGGSFELTSTVRIGTKVTVTLPPERAMTVLPRTEVEATERARPQGLAAVRPAA